MEEDGLVGGYNGSSAREMLCAQEQWDQMKGGGESSTRASLMA